MKKIVVLLATFLFTSFARCEEKVVMVSNEDVRDVNKELSNGWVVKMVQGAGGAGSMIRVFAFVLERNSNIPNTPNPNAANNTNSNSNKTSQYTPKDIYRITIADSF
jgi:hypothetical protein